MRRFFFILSFILFNIGVSCAEEDPFFELDLPPNLNVDIDKLQNEYDAKMQSLTSNNKIQKGASNEVVTNPTQASSASASQNSISKIKKKNKKDKKTKNKAKFDTVGGGYYGKIPSIKSEFGYKGKSSTPLKDDNVNAEELAPEEFQKSKIEDPLFLDVIINKEKPSKYVSDMIRVMKFLETFRTIVERHEDIQKFNANVNLLDLHARRIEKLYADTPDGMSSSYYLLLDLAYKAKVLGNLKFDANYYSKFSPVKGTEYDPENILNEDNKFLLDLDKTVFAIRQLNN